MENFIDECHQLPLPLLRFFLNQAIQYRSAKRKILFDLAIIFDPHFLNVENESPAMTRYVAFVARDMDLLSADELLKFSETEAFKTNQYTCDQYDQSEYSLLPETDPTIDSSVLDRFRLQRTVDPVLQGFIDFYSAGSATNTEIRVPGLMCQRRKNYVNPSDQIGL